MVWFREMQTLATGSSLGTIHDWLGNACDHPGSSDAVNRIGVHCLRGSTSSTLGNDLCFSSLCRVHLYLVVLLDSTRRKADEQSYEPKRRIGRFLTSTFIAAAGLSLPLSAHNMAKSILWLAISIVSLSICASALWYAVTPLDGGNSRVLSELSELTSAIRLYQNRYGTIFPRDATKHVRHIRMVHPNLRRNADEWEENARAFSQMDDAECLVYYLSGEVRKLAGEDVDPIYIFDENRLIDRDGDGFQEYRTYGGEIYQFDGSLPMVYSHAKQCWLVMPDFEPKGIGR